ncbi:hypothetical protein EEQ99_21370 [Rhizobium anhuiense]|uniref:Uncharacterized protein n=1 Tax=Rhizobium anhuiense TaxID=1184720 RepID=A0A3S0XG84_9HYPH|nr:hypothetical protein EEQ99_21370 [Rhizobium anhuiense]
MVRHRDQDRWRRPADHEGKRRDGRHRNPGRTAAGRLRSLRTFVNAGALQLVVEKQNSSNILFLTQFRTENRFAPFPELLWLPMKE